MPQSTWETRELPILTALVEMFDAGEWCIEVAELGEKTGFDEQTVQVGLRALMHVDPELIGVTAADSYEVFDVKYVTGAARQAVGTWPTPEGRAEEIIAALQAVAAQAADEDTRSSLRKVAGYLGDAGRDLLVQVAATAITQAGGRFI